MSALSGNVGASWSFGERFVPYVNVSTAFETPTTTELVNQPDGSGGFNPELGPQRAVNYEIGARGQPAPGVSYSVALFLGRVTDAIVQRPEVGGRAFFRNAGKTHNDGAEVGLSVTPVARAHAERGVHLRPLSVRRAARATCSTAIACPACPEHFWRLGLRTALPPASTSMPTTRSARRSWRTMPTPIVVDSWGAGVTNLRLGWEGDVGSAGARRRSSAMNNLWDRRYVGSVTLNGVGGRVFEPAPRRIDCTSAPEIGYRRAPRR